MSGARDDLTAAVRAYFTDTDNVPLPLVANRMAHAARALLAEDPRCPWVETSEEGTSFCRLAAGLAEDGDQPDRPAIKVGAARACTDCGHKCPAPWVTAEVAALAARTEAAERNLRVARFVAEHWRDETMKYEALRLMAHPLACVLAAMDGDTSPAGCGVDPAAHDAFRAALAGPEGQP